VPRIEGSFETVFVHNVSYDVIELIALTRRYDFPGMRLRLSEAIRSNYTLNMDDRLTIAGLVERHIGENGPDAIEGLGARLTAALGPMMETFRIRGQVLSS